MPYLRIGVVTIDESTVGFEGDEGRLVIGEPAEAFGNLWGPFSATASCER
ncbi:MAG: hypothetical protein WBO54_10345 [Thermoanaerobaculia bacterium]